MIDKGLIVSIQGYSLSTTQELSDIAVKNGAVAIRTDKPIECDVPVIGLMKFKNKKYYITTSIQSAETCSLAANFVAIDSRKGNENLKELYEFCDMHNILIVADIEEIEDVKKIIRFKVKPSYIATTFASLTLKYPDTQLIKEIRKITDIPVIAEGGYSDKVVAGFALLYGANNVCIGKAISKIGELTKNYTKAINQVLENINVTNSTAEVS